MAADAAPLATTAARRSVRRMIELAPLVLAVVAEAAWISVLGGLLQEFALHRTVLGIPALAGFVVAGIVAARLLGPRLGDRWPFVAVAVAGLGAAAGWAMADEARAAASGGLGPGLAAHPGGMMAGLAVIRGYAHARLPLAEGTLSRLLSIGIPGLAVVAVIGGLVGEPYRSAFLGDSLGAAIVFVAAAALALALVRIDEVGLDGGFDWRRNPPWLGLAVLVLVVAIAAAIPLAAVAGTVVSVLVSVALGPLLVVGLATGFDRTARRVVLFIGASVLVVFILSRGKEVLTAVTPGAAGSGDSSAPATGDGVIAASVGGLAVVAGLIAIIVLIALWMRRTPSVEPDVDETRSIDRGGDPTGPLRRRSRFGRRIEPRTAVEAYVALVADLGRHDVVRREDAETPAAHAARIRATGRPTLSLDLLAADYALARYGGVALTAGEDRRAVARWRRLRRTLTSGLRARTGATATEPVVPQREVTPEGARAGTRTGG